MFDFLNKLFRKEKQLEADDQAILPGNKILGRLLEIWPELNPGYLWLADKTYIMPAKEGLKKLLFDSQIDRYAYKSELQDCDDYALLLHAYVIHERYKDFKEGKIPENQLYSLAFGQVWYRDKKIGYHAINICITCDKGILLIEPQQDKIWKPKKNMSIDFIRM